MANGSRRMGGVAAMALTLDTVPIDLAGRQALLDVAAAAKVLFIGDLHGTREIPGLLATLTTQLAPLGYGALGLEMPPEESGALSAWADGKADMPPFFAQPSGDGRGSLEVLALVRSVRGAGWHVFAFDGTREDWEGTWASRDLGMARSLAMQRAALPAGTRVLAVCGNGHARLARHPKSPAEFWPSCAADLAARIGAERVRAVSVCFHGGTFFNLNRVRVRKEGSTPWPWEDETAHVTTCSDGGFSLELHLRKCSPATFAAPCGLRFSPMYLRARLATDEPDRGLRPIRFLAVMLASDGRSPGVAMFLTAQGNVICSEVGPEGDRAGGVLRVFPSIAEAAQTGRYRPGLLEQAAAEEGDLRAQEIELDPHLRPQLQALPDAEFLDV